ncbi:hypothetical protein NL108_012710 [Boleophthalmus pectinirostris]|nr:hypothetical protein NL108_012710 [Boleophthalmus pectinirostris]
MGNKNTKSTPKDKLQIKDWKAVHAKYPEKCTKLDLWITKYKFEGELKSSKIIELQRQIQEKCKNKEAEMCKHGYYHLEKWLDLAMAREKGRTEAKKRQQMMLSAKEEEDLATVVATPVEQSERHPPVLQSTEGLGAAQEEEEEPPPYRIYPQVPTYNEDVEQGPRVKTRHQTKSEGIQIEFSKKMGEVPAIIIKNVRETVQVQNPEFITPTAPTMPEATQKLEEPAGSYPMIQVANPRGGQLINPNDPEEGNHPETILVHRPWTDRDIDDALKGITPVNEDVIEFLEAMDQLRSSYNLNGQEVERVYRKALGHHWASVKGDWTYMTGAAPNQVIMPHNEPQLLTGLERLRQRIQNRFARRANYMEINRTKQRDDESFEEFRHRLTKVFKTHSGLQDVEGDDNCAYRQQLKNALHANTVTGIRNWIDKHYINFATGTLDQYIDNAMHADKVMRNKQKKEKESKIFTLEGAQICYSENRGRSQRGRNRGRGRGRGGYVNQRPNPTTVDNPEDRDKCWVCGQIGHWKRQCPQWRGNQTKGQDYDKSQGTAA